MKDQVLLELAAKWDRDAKPEDGPADGSEEGKARSQAERGMRAGMETCARQLRELVRLLGGDQ